MTLSPSPILPLLRRAAPRLSRHFFTCSSSSTKSSIAQQLSNSGLSRAQLKSTRQTPFLDAFRSQRKPVSTSNNVKQTVLHVKASRRKYSSAAEAPRLEFTKAEAPRSFPKISRRVVAWWLFGSAISVYGIVVFGALTRLTESGLSITEWRPVTGTLPPLSAADWELEFSKYRASPEFQKLNPNMELSEFKEIFWMEYIHRLWGRTVGVTFLLPTIYFIARRQVSTPVARNLILITGLIGLQGFVGWWMVKSGLKDDLFATGAHPRVSQYRLATHLGLAFTVYVAMLWNSLNIFRDHRYLKELDPTRAEQVLSRLSSPKLRPFRLATLALSLLVGTTAVSGALVAGLDAGLIYNEFPYMGLGLTPPKAELWDAFYSRLPAPHPDLWWRNLLENPSLVQLDHRILATTTFIAVHGLFMYARFTPAVRSLLTNGIKTGLSAALGLVWVQVTLGITTLLYLVPTSLAATHQAGSLALLTSVILVLNRAATPKRLMKLVKENAAQFSKMQKVSPAISRSAAPVLKPNTVTRESKRRDVLESIVKPTKARRDRSNQ